MIHDGLLVILRRITNNPSCIIYKHLIRLPITEHFLNWGLIALNRGNHYGVIFRVISPIKIKSTPHPGLQQLLTLTGYISGLMYFTLGWQCSTVIRCIPSQSADPCYCSCFWCSLLKCNGNPDFSNAGVDRNWKWKFM